MHVYELVRIHTDTTIIDLNVGQAALILAEMSVDVARNCESLSAGFCHVASGLLDLKRTIISLIMALEQPSPSDTPHTLQSLQPLPLSALGVRFSGAAQRALNLELHEPSPALQNVEI